MSSPEIYVVSAVRSAIGGFGGSLKDLPLADLATTITRAAIERSGVAAEQIGHMVMGTVIPTEPRDAYLSRVAAMNAGIPKETPAFNVNRLCGSGLQAIVSATQCLLLGDADVAVAAGAESMSRGPYLLPQARWGARMGDCKASTTRSACCRTRSNTSTWASPQKTSPPNTALPAKCRMNWP